MDIELESVRAEREGGFVLDVPALRLRGQRVTAILGPNGSGKTTLLRLIAGLERPRSGGIVFGGVPVRPGHLVGYVFQEQVFLSGSVRENLELGLRLRGVPASDRPGRVTEICRLLGIDHLLDRRADRLSGGEARRVSLARALSLRPPLVLLDEPLEGLDERTYLRLRDELPQVLARFDATTVLVTHTRDEAFRLADDLVVLVGGRVLAAGGKWEVATNPRLPEVAAVLGYTVLECGGRRVAVPESAFRYGPGGMEFQLEVDAVADIVDRMELAGRVGDVAVHVVLPPGAVVPDRGDRVPIHAARFFDLG
jgi:ABC-type sugar transport system ATPase subunit